MAEISDNMVVDSTPLKLADMPDEVLSNIFEFLDAESLKSSRLVSSKWNQIISKSPKLMKKLVLVIDGDRESEFNQISNFSRCYRHVRLENLTDCELTENLEKDIREIGSKVKEVRILYCKISSEVEDLIRCFPSVDHVELSSCGAKEGFKFNPEVFAGCKGLEVSSRGILFCFENLQLTKLNSLPITSTDWQRLIELLAKNNRLTALSLETYEVIPSEVELVEMQCPVESLSMFFVCELSPKMFEFFNLFGMTVKSLEVSNSRFIDMPFALLESITSNFISLTDLTLRGFIFSADPNFELLKPLETVKTMELKKIKFETSEEFSNFFKLFPQLAEIKLYPYMTVSGSQDKFLECLFKLQHVKKFIIFGDSNWKEENFRGYFVVLKNKHLSIKIGTKYDDKRAFYLAFKIFNEFDLSKDELMMSRHEAQEPPVWKPVTDEDFQAMDVEDVELKEIYRHFSVVIQKH